MSERIYGVALEDSRPLPDGKHHECWVSVGGVVTQDAGLRAIVDAQHAALVARGEAVPAPLSRRIKPGDVLEAATTQNRVMVLRREGDTVWFRWDYLPGEHSAHVSNFDGDVWRLVAPAPVPVVNAEALETMTVQHEQAQAAREQYKREVADAFDAAIAKTQAFVDAHSRRHNAHCPRCYGPAFYGAGALRCERVGGCLAEREPKVDAIDASTDLSDAAPDADVWEMSARENYWLADGRDGRYATRELAVAAWREAVIARAKREAGL